MVPSYVSIFSEVVKAMNLAESNKELLSSDKPQFVINIVMGLYPELNSEEVIIITEMIKFAIEGVIGISNKNIDISGINAKIKTCWKICHQSK